MDGSIILLGDLRCASERGLVFAAAVVRLSVSGTRQGAGGRGCVRRAGLISGSSGATRQAVPLWGTCPPRTPTHVERITPHKIFLVLRAGLMERWLRDGGRSDEVRVREEGDF